MTLWEAFCKKFGGRPIERAELTEDEAQKVWDPSVRKFRFNTVLMVAQGAFEQDPEKEIEYMIECIKSAADLAGKEMRDELEKLRSAGQKSVVS